MIIGADIGNEFVKIVTETKQTYLLAKIKEGTTITGYNLNYKGINYTIGEGTHETEFNKADKKYLMQFIYSAMAEVSTEEENKIVVGLPIGQYQQNKDRIKERILDDNINSILVNGHYKTFIIKDVLVYPEGLGTVRNDFEGIVLDIGGRTTDICLLKEEGGKRRIINPQSLGHGTLNLYNDIAKAIREKYNIDVKASDVEGIIKKGFYVDGEQKEATFIIDILKAFTDNLINTLNLDYNLRMNKIAVVGGGGALFYNSIKRRVKQAELIQEPFYANARAYYKEGERVWRRS